jgi:N-acetyl-alpha-D-glucosaminyl L-malate synthase BshA
VGDGPEMKSVCKLVGDFGLKDRVLLLGKQENLEELYSISDLMLLLSEKESFGLVALEAMACGVPCIGTKIGGIPEVIDHEDTGYLCNLGDIEDVANKAIMLLKNPELHQRLSSNALETVRTKFRADVIVGQYEDLYFKLLGRGEVYD